jgi:outer membrane protein assembly factor BamE
MGTFRNSLLIFLTLLLASCDSFYIPLLTPYKMDIRQGNFVSPDMREKLKLGMTKAQVRYVLGTPMINDAFHGSRWDYAYRLEHRGKLVESQNLTLYFEGDNLARIIDGDQPAETAPAKADGNKG